MSNSKSDNIEITINYKADKVLESLLNRYVNTLQESIKGSDFAFDHFLLSFYKCHKINPNRAGSKNEILQHEILSKRKQ